MKTKFIILLLLQIVIYAQTLPVTKSWYDFDLKINHLVREQFYSASIVYPVYKSIYFEADYGYLYYHRASANIGYKFYLDKCIPYVVFGGFIARENFTENTFYTEKCIRLGGGVETELAGNFFFNFETVVLNYLAINYSMRKIKFRENYDLGTSIDYSVSAGIGYRFRF